MYFLKHGAFRLVAAVEQAAFVRFPAPGDSTDSIYDYPQLTLSAHKVRLIQAYLSLDFDQTSPLSVCYGDYVESTRIVEARIPGTDKQMDISSITEKALLQQGKVLSSLLSEFELIAHAVLRSERLKERMSSLERQRRILKSSKKAFQQVHIPIDQMTEVIKQLERLAGSTQLAAALLLKGPSGTGKTLLAEKIAEGGMFPFIKAGVNTLRNRISVKVLPPYKAYGEMPGPTNRAFSSSTSVTASLVSVVRPASLWTTC
jgi:ATPase family associated with various cellular activities (AAA)